MWDNPGPFLILAAVVAVALWLKGVIRLPALPTPPVAAQPPAASPEAATGLNAEALGALFVQQSRREHDARLIADIARRQHEANGVTFTAPFAAPASDPNAPPAAGANP